LVSRSLSFMYMLSGRFWGGECNGRGKNQGRVETQEGVTSEFEECDRFDAIS
jgi:hypothetical protein